MAAKAGAQHVFAIEGDPSLERAARKVIAANGQAEKVTVVGRHSTAVKVGFGSDVPTGADVIVTEIFDSWLLGEGMVPVMHDAIERGLLAPHGRVVPAGAQIWAVLVESDWLACHQELPASALGGCVGKIRDQEQGAPPRRWSPPEPVQVHANMVEARGLARRLSEPFAAQVFDFARPLLYENRTVQVPITSSGRVDAVMLWWTADMDGSSGAGRARGDAAAAAATPALPIPDSASGAGVVLLSTRPCDMFAPVCPVCAWCVSSVRCAPAIDCVCRWSSSRICSVAAVGASIGVGYVSIHVLDVESRYNVLLPMCP